VGHELNPSILSNQKKMELLPSSPYAKCYPPTYRPAYLNKLPSSRYAPEKNRALSRYATAFVSMALTMEYQPAGTEVHIGAVPASIAWLALKSLGKTASSYAPTRFVS
jgi:hypothetical protein